MMDAGRIRPILYRIATDESNIAVVRLIKTGLAMEVARGVRVRRSKNLVVAVVCF